MQFAHYSTSLHFLPYLSLSCLLNTAFYVFISDSLNQKNFQLEVEALKKLRHHQLISLFAICTSSTPYYIITEYMEKGNLLDFLRSKSLFLVFRTILKKNYKSEHAGS